MNTNVSESWGEEVVAKNICNNQKCDTERYPVEKTKNHDEFWGKLKTTLRNITIEPSMLVFTTTYVIIIFATQNLGLEKACRVNLNFTDDICTALKLRQLEDRNVYEEKTQKVVAEILTWRTYITASVAATTSLFVGAWSDKTGCRNLFLIIAVIGQILVNVNDILQTYFFHELSLECLIISTAIIQGLTGGLPIYLLVSSAYISAITEKESRTFRMGLLNISCTAGYIVGNSISGVVVKTLGYFGAFGLGTCLSTINAVYLIFFVRDVKTELQKNKQRVKNLWHFLKDFFDLSLFKDISKVIFKRGPNKRRRRICVLLSITNLLHGPTYSEITFMYLYTRFKFSWNEVEYSLFQMYNTAVYVIGTMFAISLFSKVWAWDDSMLGITSTLSKIAGAFVYCFAPTGKYFYFAPLAEILNGTAFLALRSMISKLVTQDELGKASSVVSLIDTLTPLAYIPLYTKVYTATLTILPGCIFLLGACLTVPAVAVFSWVFYEHRKSLRKSKLENEAETPLTELS